MPLPGGGLAAMRVEKMSVEDQRLGQAVFTQFKEVVFSHVRVTITGAEAADVFDWAAFDRLAPLAAFLVPGMFQDDKLYLAGAKILLRDVEVSVRGDTAGSSKAEMLIDTLRLGATSDDVVLGGRLDLKIKPFEHVRSIAGGTWSPSKHVLRFSEGYWRNGKTEKGALFALTPGEKDKLSAILHVHDPPCTLGQLRLPKGFGSGEGANGQRLVMNKKFFKYVRSLEKAKVNAFLFQYLALNPDAVKQNGLSPGRVLAPNFKLGAFDPGPFFGGTINGVDEKPGPDPLWRDASDLGGGWKYLRPFGSFHTGSSRWIYHSTLGWLLPEATSTKSLTFYDPGMKTFWWTSESAYPWIYSFSERAWLYYEAAKNDARWFYNSKTGKWETH